MSYPTFHRKTRNQNTKNSQNSLDQYQISLIIQQVGKIITNLLQNITYIYSANGISYAVQQYYGVLMRILAPIELIHSKNTNHQYNVSYMPRGSSRSYDNIKEQEENEIEQTLGKLKTEKNQYFNEKYETEDCGYIMSKKVIQNSENLQTQPQNKFRRTSQLGKSQRKIYEWAKKKVSRGQELLRKDIIFQACRIAAQKGIQFRGSSGWYSRFLNRNPEMRILMSSQKLKKEDKNQSFEARESNSWRFELKSSCSEENEDIGDQITQIMPKNKTFQDNEGQSAHFVENEQEIQLEDQVKYKKLGQYYPSENFHQKNTKNNQQSSEKKVERLTKNLFY